MFLTLFLYFLLFVAASNFALRIIYEMIQHDGAIDVIFGWQKILAKLYRGNKAQQLLGKALGDCERCMSFWFMPIWFFAFYLFAKYVMGVWFTDHLTSTVAIWGVNWLMFAAFQSVSATTGFILLLFKHKK